jgi:hypothetical protein
MPLIVAGAGVGYASEESGVMETFVVTVVVGSSVLGLTVVRMALMLGSLWR